MDPTSIAELLRNEHLQIVAAILVHLDPDLSSSVLKSFTERHRNEVMVRIATLDGIQPAALKDLNEVLSRVLAGGAQVRKASLGGVKPAAEIINLMGTSLETSVLDYIREADSDLAQKIMDNMFTFDDLIKLDDKGLPEHAQGSSDRVAHHRAQGWFTLRFAKRCSRTCLPVRPKRCAKTWSRVARSSCPKWKPSKKSCSRSCAVWQTKARSC